MSTFNTVTERVKGIAKIAGFSKAEVELLSRHQRVNYTKLKVNGEEYEAWRVVHNNALGPGKGGIRFHPDVNEDEIKSLSFWMSMKNSLAGLPYGGGKGGIKFNPKEKNEKELEAISRAFIDAFYRDLGQDKDVPAPDVYTNAQIMGWMLDEYEKKVGRHEPGMITGKPLELGGLALRSDSTAHGGYIVFKEMIADRLKGTVPQRGPSPDTSVAIQGFGNAGANMMKYLTDGSYKVVAVSDSHGGIYNPKGLKYADVEKAKKEGGSVQALLPSQSSSTSSRTGAGDPGSKNSDIRLVTNEELLKLDVDVLVLAALENQVTKANADKIKAKYIIELANGPVDLDADKILFAKGVEIVPDILANSGGVVVSYFEWAQNRAGNILDERYLEEKLVVMMTESWNRVSGLAKEHRGKIDLRTAAYIIAIRRILAVEKYRGNLS